MADQEKPPRPELDLPLPEKELPAHSDPASQGETFRGRWVKLGIVAVVLLILLGGVFMLGKNNASKNQTQTVSQTPTPTSSSTEVSWTTYKNTVLELQYPSMLTVDDKVSDSWIFFHDSANVNQYFEISYSEKDKIDPEKLPKCSKAEKNPPASECLGNPTTVNGKNQYSNEDIKDITISGLLAKEFYDASVVGITWHIIQIDKPSISIRFFGSGEKYFDQILPTIKILSTNSTNSANWKTYKNSAYSYSIKYPSDFYVADGIPTSIQILNYQRQEGGTIDSPKGDFSIAIEQSKDQASTIESLLGELTQRDKTNGVQVTKHSQMKINNLDVLYRELTAKVYSSNTYNIPQAYILDGNGRTILINGSDDNRLDLFKEFISTFKFTQ